MKIVEAAGASIPVPGFGTFELTGRQAEKAVAHALAAGYRHIDTAQMYRNEEAVGRALAASGVPRADVFVTTKVWMDRYRNGDLQRSVEESLERLGLDAVDLVLLHWPSEEVSLAETLGALLEARDRGLARHVGVSNFPAALMREAVGIAGAGELVNNQVEYHPFLKQRAVRDTARELGMSVSAYCPLAQGRVFGDPVLERIAAAHGRTAGQVALRWLIEQDIVPLPRTAKAEHAEANLDVLEFALAEDDVRAIEAELPADGRLIDPSFAPTWD